MCYASNNPLATAHPQLRMLFLWPLLPILSPSCQNHLPIDISTGVNVSQVHSPHMQLPAVLVLVLVLRTPFHRKSPPTSSSSWLLVLACLSCFQFGQANTFMVKSGHLEEPHHHPHPFTPHHFALQYIIHTFSGSSHPCTHTFSPTRVYFC